MHNATHESKTGCKNLKENQSQQSVISTTNVI